jgi:hypothetical protein
MREAVAHGAPRPRAMAMRPAAIVDKYPHRLARACDHRARRSRARRYTRPVSKRMIKTSKTNPSPPLG